MSDSPENLEASGAEPEMSVDEASARRTWTVLAYLAAALICVGHFLFLNAYFVTAISSPDANGYLAQANLLAHTGRSWFELESPLQFVGIHWLRADGAADSGETGQPRFYSRYPAGLPALLAAGYKLGGAKGALLLNPLMATLTVAALFLLLRLWAGPGWGLVAALALALNPIVNGRALSHDAHTGTAFFLMWGLAFLALWTRNHGLTWAFLAGLFLGIIPSARYPEVLFVGGCALFVLLNLPKGKGAWRSLLAGGAGLALPAVALMLRNHQAYGAFWRTGYALTGAQTGFGWDYFTAHASNYLDNLQVAGVGPFFVLGVAGVIIMCASREHWRRGVLLAALIAPTTLLYMAYFWGAGGRAEGTMRFLVPTFPLYIVGGVMLLRILAAERRAAAYCITALALTWLGVVGIPDSADSMTRLEGMGAPLEKLTRALDAKAKPGDLVVANQRLHQHLHFATQYRLVDADLLLSPERGIRRESMNRTQRGPDGEDRPGAMQANRLPERAEKYARLSGNALTDAMVDDLWAWAGKDRRIFWVGAEDELRQFREQLLNREKISVVDEIELPAFVGEHGGRPDARMGGAGGGGVNQRDARMGGPGGGFSQRDARGPGGFPGGGAPGGGAPGDFRDRFRPGAAGGGFPGAPGGPGAVGGRRGGPGGGGGAFGPIAPEGGTFVIAEWTRVDSSAKAE